MVNSCKWRFRFLSILLYLHLGYGHITPETPLGQITTVIYCLVGLPIAMMLFKTLGEIISKIVYKLVFLVETRLLGRRRPRKLKIKTFCVTFLLMILTLCVGALTQGYLEDWSFVTGIYVWFATLSTIGYGDYVPAWKVIVELEASNSLDAEANIDVWLILSALALPATAGLCVVSGVLNSLVEALEEFRNRLNFRNKCAKCERIKGRKPKGHCQNTNSLMIKEGVSHSDNSINSTKVKERVRSATF